jgi:hypothetical protein
MAFTSIKVDTEDKRAFDRLRHEVALQSGQELTQHELFHRIVQKALAAKRDLVAPRPSRGAAPWRKHQFDLGVPTDVVKELDRAVYGL